MKKQGAGTVHLKRAYEPKAPGDGHRVLVERLWPRGLTKERAHLDEWLKDVAPSDSLRKWFHHDPGRWTEFAERYLRELRTDAARALLDHLAEQAEAGTVTLVYASHDEQHNNAVVLKRVLDRRLQRAARRAPKRRRTARPPARATPTPRKKSVTHRSRARSSPEPPPNSASGL